MLPTFSRTLNAARYRLTDAPRDPAGEMFAHSWFKACCTHISSISTWLYTYAVGRDSRWWCRHETCSHKSVVDRQRDEHQHDNSRPTQTNQAPASNIHQHQHLFVLMFSATEVRARGLGGCASQTRSKPLFFGQKLNFSGISQQPKKWKKYFLYLLNEKNGIRSVERHKVPEMRDFY